MYTFDSRVRYSEIDHNETITLPAIVNYFQDCCTFQSEDIGAGVEVLKARHQAWVLTYWQIVVDRYAKIGEPITACTWPTKFKGFIGERNFQLLDGEGKQTACAYSVWAYMDMEQGRPVKAPKEMGERYGMGEPLEMDYEPRKIRLPEKTVSLEPFPVRRYHIDTNEHVNNCQYIQMAMELLGKDIRIRQIRVEYKQSAVYGDLIVPKMYQDEERIVVLLCDTQGSPYAIVEIKEEK